jgi:hypothetical protein
MINFFEGTDEPGYFGFSPDHFKYDRLVRHYQDLFGRSNVIIFTQESLQDDMDFACRTLASDLGNSRFIGLLPTSRRVSAASYPEYSSGILRQINKVQKGTLNPSPLISFGTTPGGLYKLAGYVFKRPLLSSFFNTRRPVSSYVESKFGNFYNTSNQRLSELVQNPVMFSGHSVPT